MFRRTSGNTRRRSGAEHGETSRCPQSPDLVQFRPYAVERAGCQAPLAFLPPLVIALLLIAAFAALLAAAVLVPAPLPAAVAPPPPVTNGDPAVPDGTMLAIQALRAPPPPRAGTIDLVRVIAHPHGDRFGPLGPGVVLLAVVSGTLLADLDGPADLLTTGHSPMRKVGEVRLGRGDSLALSPTTTVTLVNDASEPAELLAVGFFPAAAALAPVGVAAQPDQSHATRWATAITPATTLLPLASGWWGSLPTGPVDVTLQQTLVLPREETSLDVAGELLVSVEAGAATLRLDDGLGWRRSPNQSDQPIISTRAASLLAGESAILLGPACGSASNIGSGALLLLVLTIDPSSHPATPPTVVADQPPALRGCPAPPGSGGESAS